MPKNFAEIKKMVRGLGLPVEVIDCCFRNCMIFWGSDAELTRCKICDHELWKRPPKGNSVKRRVNVPYRKMFYFPITPRLQRLYDSKATAKHMTWHAEHKILGLCNDGFQPFGAFGQNYSSWPVILTPYNLPLGMCMKDEFMFLTVIVSGPQNPKHQMDIFLQPLIAELNQLWEFGVQTFDVQRRQNFQMKAALMWTINDFSVYSMLSGWSTSRRLACPHCMENTDAFTLKGSRKQSWFDCHRKFLSRGHLYRRNTTHFGKGKTVNKKFGQPKTEEEVLAEMDSLGFMKAYEIGAEKNNAAKSTDYGWNKKNHAKSREELNDICDRPKLAKDPVTGRFPKAMYALDRDGKKALLEWIKLIKFPDGYTSNLSRCVNTIELSIFFRELTSTSLTEKDLDRMGLEIPKILCKLELSNKGRVEESISSGYLNEETAKFAAYYFSEGDLMILERLQRNEVCDIEVDDDIDRLSIFKPHGQSVGACRKRYLEDDEIVAARTYVLLNCSEIENYREVFEDELRRGNPDISNSQIEAKFESDFAYWFQQYVQDPIVCTNPFILSLAKGPLRSVRIFKGHRVNGFKF
ncbi:uncharacterized protein LOC126656787 [Mercurialis annua]|uniref:uncharacterized protein LOC126656787 n=1 Tax=Mercurialis annua TaxID=3986 RepID=UPI00216050CB|nr:uncharacterized protein LOC126656787 [Mercurialis annua]